MSGNPQALGMTLDTAIRSALDGVFVIERNRQVTFFSDACARITGVDSSAVLGSPCTCNQLLDCTDEHGRKLDGALCPGSQILNGEITQARQRLSVRRADGRRVWVETTYSPVRADNGEVSGVVGIMRDITEVMKREEDLVAAARRGGTVEGDGNGSAAARFSSAEFTDATASGKKMGPLDNKLSSLERTEILTALQETRGQRTLAAQQLGISRSRLYRRMEALGIDPRQLGSHEHS